MKYEEKDLVIFDLDGTLTPSKSALDNEMAESVIRLLAKKKVAIISGGGYPQFEAQFLNKLPHNVQRFSSMYLLPTSGTRLYTWQGTWTEKYAENLSLEDKKNIIDKLKMSLTLAKFEKPEKTYGELIEDRGSQITFSALGQSAPLAQKEAWDPTREKRQIIADILKERLPRFDVRIGGTTSIDITMKGVNKAYGIHKLEEHFRVPIDKMLFIGDALFPGGNDYPARSTGVDCIQVSGPEETKKIISEILG
jgi:HAD superfamily hydrolase (TIGR01484 family)